MGAEPLGPQVHRQEAARLFNGVWDLLEKQDRSSEEDQRMLHMAHASRYHWEEAGGTAVNLARGEWQCSRVYAVLAMPVPALHHAQWVLRICQNNGIGDFDLAFAYEALARAHAVGGDLDEARAMADKARSASASITEQEDRELLLADLGTIPGLTPT